MSLNLITSSPLFGFTLTIAVMLFYQFIFRGTKTSLLNPVLFSIFSIIAILMLTGIPYEHYHKGASILSFFLGPMIVALAVPLYKQFDKLKANALPILAGISVGVVVSISSGILLSQLFGLSREVIVSMAPKGTTSAISMNLSQIQGGDVSMTVTFVNIAGIFGYMVATKVYQLLNITSPVAKGIGLGTSSHALGTRRALEMGEEEGAMSSLAIGVAGVLTTVFTPLLLSLFGI
ncbi:MAG: LrgB family protein [Clostridiales bacterium]|nr:LrgB family protein [Clostridiales bacterium]